MELLSPTRLGALELPNRIVMAPMTRSRSPQTDATPQQAEYYRQRAGAGLIVTEGSQVSTVGQGYPFTPGIHTPAQRDGWRQVTDAVHDAGGRIVLQLWHVGRMGHPDIHGRTPVAPSALRPGVDIFTRAGAQPVPTPHQLTDHEIAETVEDFARAARLAREAGFDGVEIHGANGYLIDQFLQSGSNRRTDRYGGSAAARARLLLEVGAAVVAQWGPGRVGIRLSPGGTLNGIGDDDPVETFGYAAESLNALDLAYVHVVERQPAPTPDALDLAGGATALVRRHYLGSIITNGGHTPESAETALTTGAADLVSFGRPFIANPDLPERIRHGAELQAPDPATFYGGGTEGYLDYPTLSGAHG
ncbi:alkene reductase [Gordonia sp. (in: high G+C Gram-positive bacteria)]